VLFTIDDLPMWYVEDEKERLAAYAVLRRALEAHHVPGIAFVNAAYVNEAEWPELRRWRELGIAFANHTARHTTRSSVTEREFLGDVDAGETGLRSHEMSPAPYFRYPNLDYGATDDDRGHTCRELRGRGYFITPTSFDTRDWSWNESYHKASAETLEARPSGGVDAQAIAANALTEINGRFERMPSDSPSPLVLMIHSARFSRDYLENVLTALELRGARWVSPDALTPTGPYGPDGTSCLPACRATGRCF
jgi:peptidoglycan/xylan/chitin deacetylase (PgdA/CDA1 family)